MINLQRRNQQGDKPSSQQMMNPSEMVKDEKCTLREFDHNDVVSHGQLDYMVETVSEDVTQIGEEKKSAFYCVSFPGSHEQRQVAHGS